MKTTSAAKANRNADIVERLEAENERLRAALAWIDNAEPELVAAAETKFGFKLVVEQSSELK